MCDIRICQIEERALKRQAMVECDSAFTISVMNRSDYEEIFSKIAENAAFFLAEIITGGNIIAGYAAIYANDRHTRTAYLTLLGVKPEFQRKHIGSMLMDNCLLLARQQGMKSIRLEVLREDIGAIQFYKHYGFIAEEEKEYSFYMSQML